ncbi:SPS-sensor serine protease component ssy5 [Yamadazyma tenuis]|uniref:Peptidase S64 n=1 Tax=Candida tenuis (strain ATCC 10573 / BCRC 21748 / CBS 615 / JCM 9827 / NBRC 10315 / NRRL Y-1498 / VKM Y-70) TaxID=590646 RepID=G3AXC1_CANTC|nr:peptidase S64 [Yamadazyma tenuis ATCC 10573]EGV66337.1 peptidase S64 [Yamadazyma tenuis ATCC 10573]WEJ95536.1 SPS-sensor serine protease component ssy5 [Yamadazyma tenuis]
MSMKKFLGRHRKAGEHEDILSETSNLSAPGTHANRQSVSTTGSGDSIDEIEMFDDNTMQNDPNLNLNPSISNTPTTNRLNPSIFTRNSSKNDKSIFSSGKRTMSTNQSSHYSSQSQASKSSLSKALDYGQRLQILEVQEELHQDNPVEVISERLHQLGEDMSFAMNQYNNSISNLTSAVINNIDLLKNFTSFIKDLNEVTSEVSWKFTTYNNSHLRKIMKIYLNLYDNLLQDEVFIKLKLLLVKNFNEFATTLNTSNRRASVQNPTVITKPQNYAIGCNNKESLPNEDVIVNIINRIAATPIKIKEQNGSFIAPIVRGIAKDMNILTLYFGYPNPTDYHSKLTQSLHDLYDDIHVIVVKNFIELASTKSAPASNSANLGATTSPVPQAPVQMFKLPFRVPTDVKTPPMSLSISIENASRTSGTVGGFIYPMIDLAKQPHLESYSNSKFAISCGHVCLNNSDDETEYPHVSAPSSVLISLYKKALTQQYEKLSRSGNDATMMEAKVAYASVLKQVDQMFPMKKIKLKNSKSKQGYYETRNLPAYGFGQIIWGERTLMAMKNSNEKRLSDLAIIKVNKNLTCDQNFLGDDIAFNEFDPGLMFDNLYVRRVIDLTRPTKEEENELDLDIDEVDDEAPAPRNNNAGLPVFKYGSTTKFTQGNLNGIKLVYWLDGAIHSSEFVVNSIDNNSAFAAGGDSGSWLLSKLEDCDTISESKGLGVLGMLHSYDGEFKQFGLFTPMVEILSRLEEVTKIRWGVVGVPEKDDSKNAPEVDTESEIVSVSSFDESDESDEEFGGANPPEVD